MAAIMLRGVFVAPEKTEQVLLNCGGIFDPDRLETALQGALPLLHEMEHPRREE